MINSNHFDAGYASLTTEIINTYFDVYFERAATVGNALRGPKYANRTGAGPLRWMTFSWLLSLYFDCPLGLGIHCPSDAEKKVISDAIQAGDIVWPAFPHNAELAMGDRSMLRYGVKLSRDLAERFGVASPSVLSTRDVPGMPRASLGTLASAGVRALSEGMNGRMVRPDFDLPFVHERFYFRSHLRSHVCPPFSLQVPVNVPPAFVWASQDGSVTLPVMWHWHGYGQLGEPGDPIRIPGSRHALAYCWRGDNAGPPLSADEVLQNAHTLQTQFDNRSTSAWVRRALSVPTAYRAFGQDVVVVSSSLDEFVDAVRGDGAWERLPKVTSDLSDTWIWGVGSDPLKVSKTRAMLRARSRCEAAQHNWCTESDGAFLNFSRFALKNLEHTWGASCASGRDAVGISHSHAVVLCCTGLSVFHYKNLSDVHWSNAEFHRDLDNQAPPLLDFVSSWVEQRTYGIAAALAALPATHPLRTAIDGEFAELSAPSLPPDPHAEGFKLVGSAPCTLTGLGTGSWLNVSVGADGSLVAFDVAETPSSVRASWASETEPLGLLRYQTLVLSDFERWQAEYLIAGSGGENEYGKPASFMAAKPVGGLHAAALQAVWRRDSDVWIQLAFDSELSINYGAPASAWVLYSFGVQQVGGDAAVNVTVLLYDKTATRLPEGAYFSFQPRHSAQGTWMHSILGEWSSPLDVADGASKGLHYVSEDGAQFHSPDASATMQFETYDCGLLRWDTPLPFPTPLHADVDFSYGASFCLFNNIWNTNYPLWYPFVREDKDLKFRFQIRIESDKLFKSEL
jgi:hypothetical protein